MARNRKAKSDAELVREIVDAWNNPGAHPPYHRQMQRMLRQSWPSLAEPVRELAGRAKKGREMSKRIDHAEEASKWLGWRNVPSYGTAEENIGVAQVHATLALVEQQRIANLIALAGLEMRGPLRHLVIQTGPHSVDVKDDIAATIGLAVEQEGESDDD